MSLFDEHKARIDYYGAFNNGSIKVDIKREDLLHHQVSGNKLRKLKYNLLKAREQNHDTLLTYGGAFSNHIAATAAAGKLCGFKTIGVIRGQELADNLEQTLSYNSTLKTASELGMQFDFVTREQYSTKTTQTFQEVLKRKYGSFYNIPEGGTNELAVKGCEEILTPSDLDNYDIICVAAGTGGTAAGIINSSHDGQEVYVFSALKGDFIKKEILKYTRQSNFKVYEDSHFGGYARSNDVLIDFLNIRFRESVITLDPIYTGKMMYQIEHLIHTGVISGETRILAVHTGGIQGIVGYNAMLQKKGRKTLEYIHEV